jgi:hypothetical protein
MLEEEVAVRHSRVHPEFARLAADVGVFVRRVDRTFS